MSMYRVGTEEVYVKPDGNVQTAFMAVIWAVNRKCRERGIEPVFGEPDKIDSSDWGGMNTREVYAQADVIHVNGEAARKADPTVRIVCKDPAVESLFDEVWAELRPRICLWRYAVKSLGAKPSQIEWMFKEDHS